MLLNVTFFQGGSGYGKNIIFQNILMRNVSNPIIIDQNYCDRKEPCHQQVINQLIIPNIISFFATLIYYVYIYDQYKYKILTLFFNYCIYII